ncbi:hypothetical protein ACWGKW_16370 [Streptomyces sp. NPDC054766]|uniref:hypothetical protein n=1 Tax=Streptomyces rhizosphaerihabitans TaxID=1266770 RepID=UPI0021BDF536|nr:hypothetical protein [Streptomyces rhizosphaerihabitans]MCT9007679.1 hypothetical protein [Streptomyces rhizosphaerihabitans]WRZ88632.1 hypothetical protein OHB54_05870 [Streptomyces sp. NBC_01007]
MKELRLATPDRPIGRVTLDVGPDQGDEHGVWASLTPAEARELARRLLAHAALVEPMGPAGSAGPPDREAPRAHDLPLDAPLDTTGATLDSRSGHRSA